MDLAIEGVLGIVLGVVLFAAGRMRVRIRRQQEQIVELQDALNARIGTQVALRLPVGMATANGAAIFLNRN